MTIIAIHFNLVAIANRDRPAFPNISWLRFGVTIVTGTLTIGVLTGHIRTRSGFLKDSTFGKWRCRGLVASVGILST
jgi:hypothetical protein